MVDLDTWTRSDGEQQEWEQSWGWQSESYDEDDGGEPERGERSLWEAEMAAIWEARAMGRWQDPAEGEGEQEGSTPI